MNNTYDAITTLLQSILGEKAPEKDVIDAEYTVISEEIIDE